MSQRFAFLLTLSVAMGLSLVARDASAETVFAKSKTPVYDRPGEMARIVTRVSPGVGMRVLRKPKGDSRWYKVRVNGRTGWVPRSKVSGKRGATVRKSNRTKRRRAFVEGRSRRRGSSSGSAPEDRAGADTIDEDDEEIIEDDDEEEARPKRRAKAKRKAQPKRRASRSDDDDEEDEEEELDEEDDGDEGDADDDGGGEEDDGALKVVGSAAVFAKPSSKSDELADLEEGDKVYLLKESKSGRWLKVETAGGETGWVRASSVEQAGGYSRKTLEIDTFANAGVSLMSMSFQSDGPAANQLSAYDINASTITIGVGAVAIYDYKPDWVLGGDFRYLYGRATPGIRYQDGATSTDIPFTTHNVEIGVRGGYKIGKQSGMVLAGRVGYLYQNLTVDNFDDPEANPLLLPNENVGAIVVGARFDAPKVTDKFELRLGVDYLLPSKREQTAMLEDGQTADVGGFMGEGRIDYHWKSKWDLLLAYKFASLKTNFQGAATRPTDATEAERSDTTHTVTLGILRPF